MKLKYVLYPAIAVFMLLSGCVRDPYQGQEDDGMVRMSIDLHTASSGVVSTRSTPGSVTEEALSGNVVVMVFDKSTPDAVLKQKAVTGIVGPAGKLTASLKEESTESYINVAANISDANKIYLLGLTPGVTANEISRKLKIAATATGINPPLPMNGWSSAIAKIMRGQNPAVTISLLRSVARIDVEGATAGFTIHGVQLVNGAKEGYVMQHLELPFFGETDVTSGNMVSLGIPATSFTEKLYCFENAGLFGSKSNPTRVVIKGQRKDASSPSYYGIEIVYKNVTNKDTYDIGRNKIYTIKLNKVDKDGYANYEEAAKSESFNSIIETDIVVTDPYAYDIVTNGKQYMGTTNSEFVIYPISASNINADSQVAATISYTCDPNWSAGTITAPEGVELMTGKLEVQRGSTPLYKDIIIKSIKPSFTDGIIVLHIGNLRKEIKVRVMNPTIATGQIIGDYFTAPNTKTDYKVGEVIAPSQETSWLKVSSSNIDAGDSSLNDKITHPDGGIYIHMQPNIGFDSSVKARDGSVFVAGEKDNQRVRVYVQQEGYDVYSSKQEIRPDTYVGTFHRWNQTAERLIRIDAKDMIATDNGAWWQATVVAGRDFIVLSTEVSKDPTIICHKNAYGASGSPTYTTDDQIEANCQVDGKLRSVEGNTSDVYFKVGMTGKLSGPHSEPRYGMIAIVYGEKNNISGVHNIYVRQGEEADYIMRPWDPSTTPMSPTTGLPSRANEFPSGTRSKAVKMSPYNLTSPSPSASDNVIDMGTNGYAFTEYPSQGGYFFTASSTKALSPAMTNSSNFKAEVFSTTTGWKKEWETCPRGYRRPDDGIGRANSVDLGGNDIINSEVRQSLWLFPLKGVERSDFSNQLKGYLADGYFDRRKIEAIDSPPPGITNGIVNKGKVDAAYWGYLVFNPHNYASIFMPMNGDYDFSGAITKVGSYGSIHTRTPGANVNEGWIVAFGFVAKNVYVMDTYMKSAANSGCSIRCIKDELPPAITDDIQVEIPTDGGGMSIANIMYQNSAVSLQIAVEGRYTADALKKINTIAINAQKVLTADDYAYLNQWADKSDHNLHHAVIRGSASASIPSGAFTSSRWYTIYLVDAAQMATGSFASTLTGLTNLSLPCLDPILVGSGAFAFVTQDVQLFLDGDEYDAADKTGKIWKTHNWYGIKRY